MEQQKRRMYERKDSLNLIDYVMLGEEGEPVSRRMGRTLNISEKGILLETHIPLQRGQLVVITVALDEDLVELRGRVAHTTSADEKRFHSGIEFIEIGEQGSRLVKKYMEVLKTP